MHLCAFGASGIKTKRLFWPRILAQGGKKRANQGINNHSLWPHIGIVRGIQDYCQHVETTQTRKQLTFFHQGQVNHIMDISVPHKTNQTFNHYFVE